MKKESPFGNVMCTIHCTTQLTCSGMLMEIVRASEWAGGRDRK